MNKYKFNNRFVFSMVRQFSDRFACAPKAVSKAVILEGGKRSCEPGQTQDEEEEKVQCTSYQDNKYQKGESN